MREILGKAKTIRERLSGAKYSIDYSQREYRRQNKQVDHHQPQGRPELHHRRPAAPYDTDPPAHLSGPACNDLDNQLYGTFARCHELLRQQPVQAESREHLRELLRTESGGVVFTMVQKFFFDGKNGRNEQAGHPLSTRRNIVMIADEAHCGQYDFIDGFARYMRAARS